MRHRHSQRQRLAGGSDYPFNDVSESLKTIALYTPLIVPQGARLTIEFEYYPAQR